MHTYYRCSLHTFIYILCLDGCICICYTCLWDPNGKKSCWYVRKIVLVCKQDSLCLGIKKRCKKISLISALLKYVNYWQGTENQTQSLYISFTSTLEEFDYTYKYFHLGIKQIKTTIFLFWLGLEFLEVWGVLLWN